MITWKDVRLAERLLERLEAHKDPLSTRSVNLPLRFFAENPHLLMPLGFDEYVAFANKQQFRHMWFVAACEDCPQAVFRQPSGRWLLLTGTGAHRTDGLVFDSKLTTYTDEFDVEISFNQLFSTLYSVADEALPVEARLWTPRLWTPEAQEKQRLRLAESVSPVLTALATQALSLEDLTWRQLEDVVAETLRRSGLEIHVVKETPQGGRDIIARGELVPGEEPLEIAVEVKHRVIVGRPEVQTALWQNRMYPALLFVTSGRFGAGVLREKALPENRCRLYLKDGDALGDMIRSSFRKEIGSRLPPLPQCLRG